MKFEAKFALDQHIGAVNAVRLTSDGAYCMTASDDRTLKLWNPSKTDPAAKQATTPPQALCVQTYAGVHGYAVLDVAIATDKSRFFSVGEDRTCFLWDVATNRVMRRLQAHNHRTNAVLFNPDSTVAFTASYDKTVKCWDLRSNNRDPIQILDDFRDSVTCLGKTTTSILAGSVDGSVRVYDMRMGCMHADEMTDPITSLRVANDDRSYLVTCLGGPIRLIDIEQGKLLKEYSGHEHKSFKIEAEFCSDDKHIIAGDEAGNIHHWDLLRGELVHTIPNAHVKSRGIASIAHHPTDNNFISAGYDGIVRNWAFES